MDKLEKWHAHFVNVKALVQQVEARKRAGARQNRRTREIWTACVFTLCLEHNEDKRFLIGFPERGLPTVPVTIDQIFADDFGEIEDWDVILVADLGPDGEAKREIHQCQLVSYCYRSHPSSEDLIAFLEEKKVKKCPPGADLRLIVHLDNSKPFAFDWVKISAHFQLRRPKCPYSQVFVLAETGTIENRYWSCRQVYPLMLPMKDMDIETARRVLDDRTIDVVKSDPKA
jgi:hypothetical protein